LAKIGINPDYTGIAGGLKPCAVRGRGFPFWWLLLAKRDRDIPEHRQDHAAFFATRLPQLVGSPLSVNALREDLQVTHKAVSRWVTILERLYAIFRLSSFGAPRIRAVNKARKHYHVDWSLVDEEGPRFENLVASHLLKWVHYRPDTEDREIGLRYFRDVDRREVDFALLEDGKPRSFIECKVGDAPVSRGLRYLLERFPDCEAWQISLKDTKDFETPEGIRVCPAIGFLRRLV